MGVASLRHGHRDEIHLVIRQLANELCAVVSHFHTQSHPYAAGKVFRQVVLKSEPTSAKFEVGIRARQRGSDEFSALLNVVKVVICTHGVRIIGEHRRYLFPLVRLTSCENKSK